MIFATDSQGSQFSNEYGISILYRNEVLTLYLLVSSADNLCK